MAKKAKKDKAQLEARRYLEHVKATSFGRFSNLIVGPFGPGMNVVYGPNEAGKTTLNELVKGVMFGWPAARGAANPYRPENAERVGSLFFRDTAADEVVELKRARNADGVEDGTGLLSDIDRETYETMFALTSDELMGLDRHDEVTTRLLTAGSGTSSSPAAALEEVNERIRRLMSRSSQEPDSIANLRAEHACLRDEVRAGLAEAETLHAQERTLSSLLARRETLAHAQEEADARIERLRAARIRIEEADSDMVAAREGCERATHAYADALEEDSRPPASDIAALAELSSGDECRLRDALDELEERRIKFDHIVDNARQDANRSQADYEVLMEDDRSSAEYAQERSRKKTMVALAVVVPLFMVAAGVFFLARMRETPSLTYLVAGVVLVAFALMIAVVGIALSLRPTPVEEELASERKKKEWVMQQDRRHLEACERDADAHRDAIESFLADNGLAAAHGSLRRARHLLDEAREYRSARELSRQNLSALALQRSSLDTAQQEAYRKRAEACQEIGLSASASLEEVDALIEQAAEDRTRTARAAHDNERSVGEITQSLTAARQGSAFDRVKTDAEMVQTRLTEAYRTLSVLLVAQNALEVAIDEWERKSQPEVYARASRMLSDMTRGSWTQVRMSPEGQIEVVDAVKTVRPPHLLSLGTRQQLYLALRIALLMTADNVGRAVPVLCDDILVNFDDARRIEAARALVELSRSRQVILFTCHADIAALVRELDPQSNSVEL